MAAGTSEDGSHSVYFGEEVCTRGGCKIIHGHSARVNPDESLLLTTLYAAFGSSPLSPNGMKSFLEMVSAGSLDWHYGREHVPINTIFYERPIEQGDCLRLEKELKLYKLPQLA